MLPPPVVLGASVEDDSSAHSSGSLLLPVDVKAQHCDAAATGHDGPE